MKKKRILSAALSAVMAVGCIGIAPQTEVFVPMFERVSAEETESEVLLGDVNFDGVVDVRDAFLVNRACASGDSPSIDHCADYNGDGKVTVYDVVAIASFVANNLVKKTGGTAIERDTHSYASISLGDTAGYAGETISVPINMSCNNNFESAAFIVEWDDKALTFNYFQKNDARPVISKAVGDNYCTTLIYSDDITADGFLANMQFTIPEDAVVGTEYDIKITAVETFAEFEGENLADTVSVSGGSITVLPKVESSYIVHQGNTIEFEDNFNVFEIISAKSEIASVVNNVFEAVSTGVTELEFKYADVVYSSKVTVTSPKAIEMEVGEQRFIFASDDISNVIWFSPDKNIVTFENGILTAVSEGVVSVSALDEESGKYLYNGIVTVKERAVTTSNSDTEPKETTATSIYTLKIPPVETVEDYSNVNTPTPSIYLSNISGMPGETVSMPVKFKCNDYFSCAEFKISWDETLITYSQAELQSNFGGGVEKFDSNKCKIVCYTPDEVVDGTIATIDFVIPKNAEYGTVYDIDFSSVDIFETYDGNEINEIADTIPAFNGTITVGAEPISHSYIDIYPGDMIILAGIYKEFDNIISGNDNIAYIDEGVIHGVSEGNTYIELSNSEATHTIYVNVCAGDYVELELGESKQVISPSTYSYNNVVWVSDNENVVSIDENNGLITGNSNGTAIISAINMETGNALYQTNVTVLSDEPVQTTTVTTSASTTTVTTISTTVSESETTSIETTSATETSISETTTVGVTTPELTTSASESVTGASSETTVSTVSTTETTTTVTEPTEGLNGDANGDGKINVRDAATIASALANSTLSELKGNGDYNNDGKINVRDAAAIAADLANGILGK